MMFQHLLMFLLLTRATSSFKVENQENERTETEGYDGVGVDYEGIRVKQ